MVQGTEALAAAAGKIGAELIALGDGPAKVLVVPDEMNAQSVKSYLAEYLPRPERKTGGVWLQSVQSLIDHINRFKLENSLIYTNRSRSLITCVYNAHAPHDGLAEFEDFRAGYTAEPSEEWAAWRKNAGKRMKQGEFAAFVEDHITDVADPGDLKDAQSLQQFLELLGTQFATPAKLLELSRGLAVRESSKVSNATNLSTGEATLVYESTLQSVEGGPIKVPGAFLIAIPVYEGDAAYRIAVRLRFRVTAGQIEWWYDLHDANRMIRHAFDEACEAVKKGTSLPLFYGGA